MKLPLGLATQCTGGFGSSCIIAGPKAGFGWRSALEDNFLGYLPGLKVYYGDNLKLQTLDLVASKSSKAYITPTSEVC